MTTTTTRRLIAALAGAALFLGACAGDEAEITGQDVIDSAEQTAEDAADRAGDLAEQGGDAVEDATDNLGGEVRLSVSDSRVEGDKAVLTVQTSGIDIVAADGDTSGETGHYHVFVDRDPVSVGETIPREDGIIHAAASPIEVPGLSPGEHRLTIVLGDGNHTRIHGDVEAQVTVTVG